MRGGRVKRLNPPRTGSISPVVVLALLSLVVVVGLFFLAVLLRPAARRQATPHQEPIRIYCAAGVAKPMEVALELFRSEFDHLDVAIVRTGGSGKLLGQIETEFQSGVERGADLYITSDAGLLQRGHDKGIIAEHIPMARQNPVIAVPVTSNLELANLVDLTGTENVRFGIANENAAIGKTVRAIASQSEILSVLESRRKMETENVMQLAQALQSQTLDAAIVWDATVQQINEQSDAPILKIAAKLEPPADSTLGKISIGVVSTTEHPTDALRVARFLSSQDKGLKCLANAGFQVVSGDSWEEVPEIHLYCGSMFSPVFEQTVQAFAEREGVNIYPRWEGCGKLVAAMDSVSQAELFPDVFLACDQNFLGNVADRFQTPELISTNQIVLAIRKDVQTEITTIENLLSSELRFGICDPDDSALGQLTRTAVSHGKDQGQDFYQRLSKQASVITDTGPTLVSQLLAGGLDVAIVYRSNVLAGPDNLSTLRIVPLESDSPATRAIQAWAISHNSNHKQLLSRLFAKLTDAQSQSLFDAAGFEWTYHIPSRKPAE